ncbi:hypothetical protein [Sphingomonas xinjiangensis]|uniref:Uncharacterized protein n=1 Tax=Sphingomonas xinjiangensis TaxID=643568 RepID=A0A840YEC7_9SPHN|nr:hypothetical protein [Sphingomonas xinjiangensis]MBB5709138.1 hypothetical protein [Sphingomonas xinjiangensis]
MKALLALVLVLTGCSDGGGAGNAVGASADLESAAIARGLVRDPDAMRLAGLYARDTDRVCVRPRSGNTARIGVFVDYGDGITCSAAGSVRQEGETLHLSLGPGGGCAFEARFDGAAIRFPGTVPAECASLCAKRASLSGLEVSLLSESDAEAAALRDAGGRRLCGV